MDFIFIPTTLVAPQSICHGYQPTSGVSAFAMEGRGLTLRSKSRRPRPQISAPKPIADPAPANNRNPENGPGNGAASAPSKERAPQSEATSDLVKRRYSTRFNQVPDFDASAPPVPGLPPGAAKYGGLAPPATSKRPSPNQSGPPEVDLNALRDPSLPVDRCRYTPAYSVNVFDDVRRKLMGYSST